MRSLTLVRHAETAWNADGRALGSTDLPLSPRGAAQARRLGHRLSGERYARVYTSDQARAVGTATTILVSHPTVPLDYHTGLREIDFGADEGRLLTEMALSERALLAALATRVGAWLAEAEASVPEGHLLVVAHGGPLRVLLCLLLGLPVERHWSFRLDCAGVSVVDCAPGLVTLRLLNDCCHLHV